MRWLGCVIPVPGTVSVLNNSKYLPVQCFLYLLFVLHNWPAFTNWSVCTGFPKYFYPQKSFGFKTTEKTPKSKLKAEWSDGHVVIQPYINLQTHACVKPLFSRHALFGRQYVATLVRQLSSVSWSACLPGSPSRISLLWHLKALNHFNNCAVNSAS